MIGRATGTRCPRDHALLGRFLLSFRGLVSARRVRLRTRKAGDGRAVAALARREGQSHLSRGWLFSGHILGLSLTRTRV